jgi:protein-S-isoprenylcysteine O-methyltransferase Ste14
MNPGENPISASGPASKARVPGSSDAAGSTRPTTAYQSGAKIVPPLIYVVVFGTGLLLQRFLPVVSLSGMTGQWVTLLCMCISTALAVWSFASFWRARTSPLPIQPSAALVTTGPYRFIRNPMYVSLAFLYAGLAFWYDIFWALLLLPAAIVLVRYLVLAGEERYLEQRFGDEYRRYKERVPRWLPRLRR